jgi:hypothetical protein
MNLAEGCCGQRILIDERERAVECHAQLGLGEGADGRERDGRHLVLQALEFLGDLGGKHVQPRGHELADLDHESAQVDGEHVKSLRDSPQACRPVPRRESPESDARQKQFVPPRLQQVAGSEPQDPAVTGTHVPDVGHLVSLPDADR